ncbi:MAG: ketoacyl-ACP synthase III [Ignavibacteriales bacterium]|nr:ketoacyl-ACP synthase III [Ignavibacteriales bacterium]
MIISTFNNIGITGISVALPTQKLTVETFIPQFGEETIKKFSEITGVKSICRANSNQTAGDLGYEAAKDLINKKSIPIENIDNLIFVTGKPDYRLPATASIIHYRLGLKKECGCFDINLGCSGYINGLFTAYAILNNSDSDNVLLVTGDTSARTISPQDRSSFMLFGDCGTATFLKKNDSSVETHFTIRSDGNRFRSIIVPAGAFRNINASREEVVCSDDNIRSKYNTYMQGLEVFNFTISDVPKQMKDFLNYLNKTVDDYDCFAFHQANLFILKQLIKRMKINPEKFHVSIDRYGNISSNTIPLVLADRYGNTTGKKLKLFLSGFGIGLSWGCVDVKIDSDDINPLIFTDDYYKIDISSYFDNKEKHNG